MAQSRWTKFVWYYRWNRLWWAPPAAFFMAWKQSKTSGDVGPRDEIEGNI
jgi:hypothetical protein